MTYRDLSISFSVMPQETVIKPDNCKYNIWMGMNKYVKSLVAWEDGYDPFDQNIKVNPIHFNGIFLVKNIAAVLINGCITYYSISDQVNAEIYDTILQHIEEYIYYAKSSYISGDNMILYGYHLAVMIDYIIKYQCNNNYAIDSIKAINKNPRIKYIYRYQFQTPNPSIRLQFMGVNCYNYDKIIPDATAIKCQYHNDSKWITEYSYFITNRSTRFVIASQAQGWFDNETGIVKAYREFVQFASCSVDFFDRINDYTSQKYIRYVELLFARVYIINSIYKCSYNDIFEAGYFGKDIEIPADSKYWKQKSF